MLNQLVQEFQRIFATFSQGDLDKTNQFDFAKLQLISETTAVGNASRTLRSRSASQVQTLNDVLNTTQGSEAEES